MAAATSPTEARVTMTAVMVAVNFILKVFGDFDLVDL